MKDTNKIDKTPKFFVMCLVLKAMTMPALKKRISVGKDPVMITDNSMIFQYYVDGHAKHYELDLEDAGEVLCEAGLISRFEGLKLYKKRISTVAGKEGEAPMMWAIETEVEPGDLKMTSDDVIHIVANWEYKIIGRLMGLIPYKPEAIKRRMNTAYNKAI